MKKEMVEEILINIDKFFFLMGSREGKVVRRNGKR